LKIRKDLAIPFEQKQHFAMCSPCQSTQAASLQARCSDGDASVRRVACTSVAQAGFWSMGNGGYQAMQGISLG